MTKKIKREYYVYVIGLRPSFAKTKSAKKQNPNFVPGPNKRCYYLGYSSLTLEERYEKHTTQARSKKGGHKISSGKEYNYGYRGYGLRSRRYKNINPLSSQKIAEKKEVELAEKLRKKGHCVYRA